MKALQRLRGTRLCHFFGVGQCSVEDPDFDPEQRAVYYARAFENPSCRFSTRICNASPPDERPSSCSDPNIPQVIQDRAWTSPIWYTPSRRLAGP